MGLSAGAEPHSDSTTANGNQPPAVPYNRLPERMAGREAEEA